MTMTTYENGVLTLDAPRYHRHKIGKVYVNSIQAWSEDDSKVCTKVKCLGSLDSDGETVEIPARIVSHENGHLRISLNGDDSVILETMT